MGSISAGRGIDHILVDEAQDTSPTQWAVIEKLAEEFTSGSGARDINRTIFVVGDKKQSIYSFQGADPREFDRMREEFATQIKRIPTGVSINSIGIFISIFTCNPAMCGSCICTSLQSWVYRTGNAQSISYHLAWSGRSLARYSAQCARR